MEVRNYALVTGAYWAFTITDGALRMLVLLYFHDLGYSPVSIAFLFLLYEFVGVLTNLLGGWVGARSGLRRTLFAGLALQVVALLALSVHNPAWSDALSVVFVMGLQALSGVAKDLTKMSSKTAVKYLAGDGSGALFRLVALLTGSKNALKGVGFFVGAALLSWFGWDVALWLLAALVAVALVVVLALLRSDMGRAEAMPGLDALWSSSDAVNRLSLARLFLFGSRDIWFVVALPIFLADELGWSFEGIGAFMALWVIGYGVVQSAAPRLLGSTAHEAGIAERWVALLAGVAGLLAASVLIDRATAVVVIGGLIVFGVIFAINSSLHSFLILAWSRDDGVAIDVGFYYAANALGRLLGTLLSGLLYLLGGLPAAMIGATLFLLAAWFLTTRFADDEEVRPSRDGRLPGIARH